jgi:ATPase subunit of ABC transporter with duplicated ATPase domains
MSPCTLAVARSSRGSSLRVGEKDRIGLVGPNGSGKTTLLRLIAREQIPDGGAVHRAKTMRLGYLPQDVHVEGGKPLLAFILTASRGARPSTKTWPPPRPTSRR